jgi:hypothetical protein
VTLQNNVAQGITTDLYSELPGSTAAGGAVCSYGTLIVTGSLIRDNTAIGGQGHDGFWYYGLPGSPKLYDPPSDGGNGLGGGIFVGGGSATISSTSITSNTAQGGDGGSGVGHSHSGQKGKGIGGGIYSELDTIYLDAFTLDHTRHNQASTSDNDIFGTYSVIG